MTDKELRKMGRGDLLEMLIKERTENESLSARLNASSTELLEAGNQLAQKQDELAALQAELQEMRAQMEEQRAELEAQKAELEAAQTRQADLQGELDRTQQRLVETTMKLDDKTIELQEAGNIADASMKVHGIFETAQAAADQYLESVRVMKERVEEECTRRASDSKDAAERLLAETRNVCRAKQHDTIARCDAHTRDTDEKCAARLQETEDRCAQLLASARADADSYWKSLSDRLENFYDAHKGMREIISFYDMKMPEFGKKTEGRE